MKENKNKKKLSDVGIYLFWEEFNPKSCRELATFIIETNIKKDKPETITIVINSSGGKLSSLFGIIDIIEGSNIPINTIVTGMACSCGLLLAMSGNHRIATPNAMIMSHHFSGLGVGNFHNLVSNRKKEDFLDKIILNHYIRYTNLTEKIIREKLIKETDSWITAKEALEFGIIDEVKDYYIN